MVDRWKCKYNDGLIFLYNHNLSFEVLLFIKKITYLWANGKKVPNNECPSVLVKVEFYNVVDWLFIEN